MMRSALLFTACINTAAFADCAPHLEQFLYCKLEGNKNEVQVCFNGVEASYSFGPVGGTPELSLKRWISDGAQYYPWQGVGRSIAEGIEFENEGYFYEAFGGFDRLTGADDSVESSFGGIRIRKDDAVIVELSCIPETVEWMY